jgi:8-oxo-dGTP pyrophosphatase MutT (NUDIX family)
MLRESDLTLGGRRARLTLYLSEEMPAENQVGAAHCLGFDRHGRFLLVRHTERQWTIPGGRRETGESIEGTLRRETLEEAAAVIAQPRLLAVERLDFVEPKSDDGHADPRYQVFFVAEVTELGVLVPNAETTESGLFAVEEARALPGWVDDDGALFDAAVAAWRRRGERDSDG